MGLKPWSVQNNIEKVLVILNAVKDLLQLLINVRFSGVEDHSLGSG
jgi:hypothetical protein